MLIRVVAMIAAPCFVVYCAIGVWRGDLFVSLSKSGGNSVHLHGPLAWLCFAGSAVFCIGLMGLVAPEFGDGEYNIAARRRRFGPIMLIGLAFFVAPQVFVGLRS
ncbi:MAG TPA: hypothetical protein VIY90_08570 [Steroidobacteraceae bacterium]